ncbi:MULTISPECIES: hypothetical protein [unclassified Fusibacter]|uniref:hypothetical protein n=1 Tax=unclassified Fusibacter TaxID=2624464 RepID=UPI001011BFFD|nr:MULTISPECIES: hypothetical protein [unclassified Fusibacter]MCK8058234.1 hypothetical protein [Fusibacter sp. A2]NPE20817.1 hypothetical protein [Fusibacter sp. A1]
MTEAFVKISDPKKPLLVRAIVEEAAGVIKSAYEHNPVFENVGTIDDYKRHIEAVFDLVENKRSLYEASAVMVEKSTGKLVDTCFNMEFEQLPICS